MLIENSNIDRGAVNPGFLPKILLQESATCMYFVGLGQWSTREEKALKFESVDRARAFLEKSSLKNVQIIVRLHQNSPP